MDAAAGLGALFVSSFVSATLFPGGSEAVLWGVVHADQSLLWPAILMATAGNTLGGLSSYVLGRVLPQRQHPARDRLAAPTWSARPAAVVAAGHRRRALRGRRLVAHESSASCGLHRRRQVRALLRGRGHDVNAPVNSLSNLRSHPA